MSTSSRCADVVAGHLDHQVRPVAQQVAGTPVADCVPVQQRPGIASQQHRVPRPTGVGGDRDERTAGVRGPHPADRDRAEQRLVDEDHDRGRYVGR